MSVQDLFEFTEHDVLRLHKKLGLRIAIVDFDGKRCTGKITWFDQDNIALEVVGEVCVFSRQSMAYWSYDEADFRHGLKRAAGSE